MSGRFFSPPLRYVFQYWGTFTRTFLTMFEARYDALRRCVAVGGVPQREGGEGLRQLPERVVHSLQIFC